MQARATARARWFRWSSAYEYQSFAVDINPKETATPKAGAKRKRTGREAVWTQDLPFVVRAMVLTDDVLARLMTFNNVVVTSHQAYLTHEALANIADTTFANIDEFVQGKRGAELTNAVGGE